MLKSSDSTCYNIFDKLKCTFLNFLREWLNITVYVFVVIVVVVVLLLLLLLLLLLSSSMLPLSSLLLLLSSLLSNEDQKLKVKTEQCVGNVDYRSLSIVADMCRHTWKHWLCRPWLFMVVNCVCSINGQDYYLPTVLCN